jgi:hypothetical protein
MAAIEPRQRLALPELHIYVAAEPEKPRAGVHHPAPMPSAGWDDAEGIQPRTARGRALVERIRWARDDPYLDDVARDLFVAGYALVSHLHTRARGMVALQDPARAVSLQHALASPYSARRILDGLSQI